MNMQQIRKMAKNLGIQTRQVKKCDLVKSIQIEEGNFDCFATAYSGECDQKKCLWKKDCFQLGKKLSPRH
jgi:hypothetical protein